MKNLLSIHPEVKEALATGQPVVALESTVITHGLPYPDNLNTAQALEAEIRKNGAVPATIVVLSGQLRVGLSAVDLQTLATSSTARKCSLRDLPIVVAQRETGSTTVAATMAIAHQAGIGIFATGGIGGVHQNAPYDVSADLVELGRTPMTVVCSGAKSVLDLPRTLERLETDGVCVVGYQTDHFPAFYTRSSGLGVDVRCDTPEVVADLITARNALELQAALLVTVPVPAPDALSEADAATAIHQALEEAREQQITGKQVTPFLLARISTLTGEASKKANMALLLNNAGTAAQIAVALWHRNR